MKFLLCLCVCLILSGYSSLISQSIPNRPGKLEVFDITEGFLSPKNILLSEVCTGIEYIRLETKPDFFIKRFDIVEIGRKFIVIADTRDYQAFLFHRDGRFVKHLGKIGKGPGEFVSCYNVSLSPDETSVAIFDASRQKAIIYQTGSSNYQEVTINGLANEVVFGSVTHLLVSYNYPSSVTNSNFQFAWFDLKNNSRSLFGLVPESIRSWGNIEIPLSNYKGQLMIDQLFNDTIYSIGQPGQLEPRYFFEIRKNRMPAESYRRPENLINYSADKARFSRWVVTDRWIFLNGAYFNKVRNMVYDRKTTTCGYIPYLAEFHDALIENDLDGGPPFWVKGSTCTGDLFNVIHPYKIIEYNENGFLNRYPPKDKKAASVFSKMKSELSENDNPVIQIIQLKN